MNKNIIIASTSTVHGSGYLEYLLPTVKSHFQSIDKITFIPFARPGGISYDEYTDIVAKAFRKIGIGVQGLHEHEDMRAALTKAQGIFTGGGNTFVLVNALYKHQLMEVLRQAVHTGIPYLGTSAGSNICGLTMQTTNDMPIVYPPSFKTLGLVPFNINPHYLDPIKNDKHMGETRETRLKEFHTINTTPVVGIREGSWLSINSDTVKLEGSLSARIFEQGKDPYEIESGQMLRF